MNRSKKIYKVNLYSIDKKYPYQLVKKDESKGKNLYNCDNVVVAKLLVYKNLFTIREIVTGKIIPRLIFKDGNYIYTGLKDEAVFVYQFQIGSHNLVTDYSLVDEYLEENLDPKKYLLDGNYVTDKILKEKYLEYLNDIFKVGYEDYVEILKTSGYTSLESQKKYEKKLGKNKIIE